MLWYCDRSSGIVHISILWPIPLGPECASLTHPRRVSPEFAKCSKPFLELVEDYLPVAPVHGFGKLVPQLEILWRVVVGNGMPKPCPDSSCGFFGAVSQRGDIGEALL